jgi:hypothetical protein
VIGGGDGVPAVPRTIGPNLGKIGGPAERSSRLSSSGADSPTVSVATHGPESTEDDQAEPEEQGRGEPPTESKPRSRSRRPAATGPKPKGRKLSLPDSVFDRLQLTAFQKRKTISAVATEILDLNLPKLRIEREG